MTKLFFTATMIGGLVGISQAQGNGGGVTLAKLAPVSLKRRAAYPTGRALTTPLRRWSIALQRHTRRCDSMRPRSRTTFVTRPEIPAESPPRRAPRRKDQITARNSLRDLILREPT